MSQNLFKSLIPTGKIGIFCSNTRLRQPRIIYVFTRYFPNAQRYRCATSSTTFSVSTNNNVSIQKNFQHTHAHSHTHSHNHSSHNCAECARMLKQQSSDEGILDSKQHTQSENTSCNDLAGKMPRCWSCDKIVSGGTEHYCKGCNVIQPLPAHLNFFQLFEVPERFDINQKQITEKYKSLQRRYHPDSFHKKSKREQEISSTQSAAVNHAYNVMKKPHLRAQYLLQLRGEAPMHEETIDDPELLMEIMEKREAVEEASEDEVEQIGRQNLLSMEECSKQISDAFKHNDTEKAKDYIRRLQYYVKIQEAVEERLGVTIK